MDLSYLKNFSRNGVIRVAELCEYTDKLYAERDHFAERFARCRFSDERCRDAADALKLCEEDMVSAGKSVWARVRKHSVAELSVLEFTLGELRNMDDGVDWRGHWYPEALIAEGALAEFARQHAEKLGRFKGGGWPSKYVDWEKAAKALHYTYMGFELDDDTFYYVPMVT